MIKNTRLTEFFKICSFALLTIFCIQCTEVAEPIIEINKGANIVLVGNNLCSRMINYSHFETELYMRYGDSTLITRNMCDGGNTAGFRQHSGRSSPWAFPGANQFNPSLDVNSNSKGHFDTPDVWLTKLQADVIIGFFGFNESFQGEAGVENFKGEIQAYIDHLNTQKYNGTSAPQLVLVSPIALEDLSDKYDFPDGITENANIELYATALQETAEANSVPFVDVFTPSTKWFAGSSEMTIDGSQMNDAGYKKFGQYLAAAIFGGTKNTTNENIVHEAVKEKNYFWHNDFKIPNGVHVFGRRYNPFGPDNYPDEFIKLREMTSIRDSAVWLASNGISLDLAAEDAKTHKLPDVESNYKPGDYGRGTGEYLYGQDALDKLTVPEGYKVDLFASEREFPDLANPVQIAFDNEGRCWVAVMPTYPHWKPGDPKPNDKLIILEDTDKDGKADKQTTFLDNIHLPVGFEITEDGVYVSQGII